MDVLEAWLADLEARHLARFEFAQLRKALQALSAVYVERRDRLGRGAALDSEGKRAAFALFYAPLHFLFVREVVRALGAAEGGLQEIVDLGCGTAPAAVAWAAECGGSCRVAGYERHAWAAAEARRTLDLFRVAGRIHGSDLARAAPAGKRTGIVAAYSVNELDEGTRRHLLRNLLRAAGEGARVLVVEPLSGRVTRYWPEWEAAFVSAGGRADQWRFGLERPELLRRLDVAAGLDHRELRGRTLWIRGGSVASPRTGGSVPPPPRRGRRS